MVELLQNDYHACPTLRASLDAHIHYPLEKVILSRLEKRHHSEA